MLKMIERLNLVVVDFETKGEDEEEESSVKILMIVLEQLIQVKNDNEFAFSLNLMVNLQRCSKLGYELVMRIEEVIILLFVLLKILMKVFENHYYVVMFDVLDSTNLFICLLFDGYERIKKKRKKRKKKKIQSKNDYQYLVS